MVYHFIIFCSKLAEQRVKNVTSSLQHDVSLWGEQRILLPCSISIKGFDFCSVKSS